MVAEGENTPSSATCVKASQVENAFPTPPRGVTPDPNFRINGRLSPGPRKFMSVQERAQSTPPELTNDRRFRSLTKGTGSESLEQSWSRRALSKKKSQYYEEAFACREPYHTAKDRVVKDSVILADVKLNCCVSEQSKYWSVANVYWVDAEQGFLFDLSFRLSEIYQRPASCIMVIVATETALLISGSSEPAYLITLSALPSEIAPTKNKRSAHLIQQFMEEAIQISPRRGVVRFEAVPEENLATDGVTALQEIERLERNSSDEGGILRALSRQKSRRSKKPSIPFPTDHDPGKTSTPIPRACTPSNLPFSAEGTEDSKSTDASVPDRKRVKRRKNILTFFKK
jgi:Macrophage migration inhibitory factor (MIF)